MTDIADRPETEEEAIARMFPPVLTFVGPTDKFLPGIPMRDLSENDVERIVYRRSVGERDDRHGGHAPGDPEYPEARAAEIERLAGSPFFELVGKPPKTKKPTEASDAAPADAAKE